MNIQDLIKKYEKHIDELDKVLVNEKLSSLWPEYCKTKRMYQGFIDDIKELQKISSGK